MSLPFLTVFSTYHFILNFHFTFLTVSLFNTYFQIIKFGNWDERGVYSLDFLLLYENIYTFTFIFCLDECLKINKKYPTLYLISSSNSRIIVKIVFKCLYQQQLKMDGFTFTTFKIQYIRQIIGQNRQIYISFKLLVS